LPRSAFDRNQITGNMRRSHVIRYKPDCNHFHCSAQVSVICYISQDWAGICQLWLTVQCCMLHGGEDVCHCSISVQLWVVSEIYGCLNARHNSG